MNDQIARLIAIGLCLVLVVSSLLARRWTFQRAAGMAVSWIVIFGLVLVIFSYRYELGLVAERVQSELGIRPQQRVSGGTLIVPIASDGHYWVQGELDGHPVRLLVDSGASITAISENTANRIGLNVDRSAMPVLLQTANGTIETYRARLQSMAVGPIEAKDIGVVVSPAFGNIDVVGMNFLSRLKSWRVESGRLFLDGGMEG